MLGVCGIVLTSRKEIRPCFVKGERCDYTYGNMPIPSGDNVLLKGTPKFVMPESDNWPLGSTSLGILLVLLIICVVNFRFPELPAFLRFFDLPELN